VHSLSSRRPDRWERQRAPSAHQPHALDGSRRIVIATNRRVSFREVASNTRSMQYQLTLIEIHLDKDGKGEGKMVPAAKVSWDKKDKKIEVEDTPPFPSTS
jgi:hypothetical protein